MSPYRIASVRSAMEEVGVVGQEANDILQAIEASSIPEVSEDREGQAETLARSYVADIESDGFELSQSDEEMLVAEIAAFLLSS